MNTEFIIGQCVWFTYRSSKVMAYITGTIEKFHKNNTQSYHLHLFEKKGKMTDEDVEFINESSWYGRNLYGSEEELKKEVKNVPISKNCLYQDNENYVTYGLANIKVIKNIDPALLIKKSVSYWGKTRLKIQLKTMTRANKELPELGKEYYFVADTRGQGGDGFYSFGVNYQETKLDKLIIKNRRFFFNREEADLCAGLLNEMENIEIVKTDKINTVKRKNEKG